MEVQSDHHGLLVVSLDNCMASETCELTKSNNCIYTTAMASGVCGQETSVVQLATPIQCISDIRQPLPRIQQHITQLQPIQYTQAMSYEPSQQLQHSDLVSNHTLYQPMTVSTTPIHTYTPSNPNLHNPFMNTSTMPVLTPSPSFNNPSTSMEDLTVIETEEMSAVESRNENIAEPTYPAEGFDYFLEIQNYLLSEKYPPGVSNNYKKCLKKRAKNYLIIDGKLNHNKKQPKEVIMRKDQQEDMLGDIHIVKDTGIHLGVKKMFSKLNSTYFWRGMYTDVVSFVKKCDKCSDQLEAVGQKPLTVAHRDSESEDMDDPSPLLPSNVFSASRIWRKVEVEMHGPFRKTCGRNEFLLTMADPQSRWCCGRAISGTGQPALQLTDFLIHSFCNFGFARCFLISHTSEFYDAVSAEYTARMTQLGEVFSTAKVEALQAHEAECGWVRPLVKHLVSTHPMKWDKHLDQLLFKYRMGELTPANPKSPFSMMFSHSPLGFRIPDDNKENFDNNVRKQSSLPQRKPNINSLQFQCHSCDKEFNSRISFRIHQRKHHSEAAHRKRMFSRYRLPSPKSGVDGLSSLGEAEGSESLRESTVSAVKALLQATKEQRRRRGKYHKYSVELQEQIAAYAVKLGNVAAVRHFSEHLDTTVSESTVRNLVKIHNAFTPTVKEEIGRFASNYGVEAAAKSFSEWLKRDISQTLVRKFKIIYLNKRPENLKLQKEKQMIVSKRNFKLNKQEDGLTRGQKFTSKQKEEIGEYACTHSVKETVKYFTQKLQFPVKERTVRRFHKYFIDTSQTEDKVSSTENDVVVPNERVELLSDEISNIDQGPTHVNVYTTLQASHNNPGTLYQLDQTSADNTAVCYQDTGSSIITSQSNDGSFTYQTMQNFQNSDLAPVSIAQPAPYPVTLIKNKGTLALSVAQNQQTQTCLIPQHSLIVTQDGTNPILSHFMATAQPLQQTILTIIPDKETQKVPETIVGINNLDFQNVFNCKGYQESTPVITDLVTEQQKEKQQEEDRLVKYKSWKTSEITMIKTVPVKSKKVDKSVKKRGTYTAYSPEIRAEIGKFAAEHGSIRACQHFAQILGHDVPESTARGLKEKYLLKKKHCQVTSLGYCQRGRPLRLGKYDEIVQDCLKDLVRSGEKVSAFLAITTAKEILNKYEPSLLEENGGNLKINMTWAKSFLKRIGIHNNS